MIGRKLFILGFKGDAYPYGHDYERRRTYDKMTMEMARTLRLWSENRLTLLLVSDDRCVYCHCCPPFPRNSYHIFRCYVVAAFCIPHIWS